MKKIDDWITPIALAALALFAASLPLPSEAKQEVRISLGSYHIPKDSSVETSHLNEKNFGIGLTDESNYQAGFFHNSYDSLTIYGGKRWQLTKRLGMELGIAHYGGWQWKNTASIVPIGQVTYDINRFRIGYAPTIDKDFRGLFTFQILIK